MGNIIHLDIGTGADEVSLARISTALNHLAKWPAKVPPTGSTGNAADDSRLADAYRLLSIMPVVTERLNWIERQLFTVDDFPPPNLSTTCRRTFIAWWHEIYAAHCKDLQDSPVFHLSPPSGHRT